MIDISGLSVGYGSRNVLKNINLNIEAGFCYGVLGPNGCGKSTLFNCIVDLVKPSAGTLNIDGLAYREHQLEIKKKIGLVSESNPLIDEFTGWQYLEFIGLLRDIEKKQLQHRLSTLTSYFFEETDVLHKDISTFSTGMRKRLAICAAVLHQPGILLLDEPFTGLDILGVERLINFLKFYQNDQRTILISSHDLLYLRKVASHIIVLHKEQLVFNDTIAVFTQEGAQYIDNALLAILMPAEQATPKEADLSWMNE